MCECKGIFCSGFLAFFHLLCNGLVSLGSVRFCRFFLSCLFVCSTSFSHLLCHFTSFISIPTYSIPYRSVCFTYFAVICVCVCVAGAGLRECVKKVLNCVERSVAHNKNNKVRWKDDIDAKHWNDYNSVEATSTEHTMLVVSIFWEEINKKQRPREKKQKRHHKKQSKSKCSSTSEWRKNAERRGKKHSHNNQQQRERQQWEKNRAVCACVSVSSCVGERKMRMTNGTRCGSNFIRMYENVAVEILTLEQKWKEKMKMRRSVVSQHSTVQMFYFCLSFFLPIRRCVCFLLLLLLLVLVVFLFSFHLRMARSLYLSLSISPFQSLHTRFLQPPHPPTLLLLLFLLSMCSLHCAQKYIFAQSECESWRWYVFVFTVWQHRVQIHIHKHIIVLFEQFDYVCSSHGVPPDGVHAYIRVCVYLEFRTVKCRREWHLQQQQ